ncbi:xaa-Pro aminopeptidase 1-like isoform X2 [Saccostrea echinata]|uniref:xaa-Pro aminopeptidase 1-like isoform X2 n=1 Tax=Saccostrea echinata TaxID=191078 RepID=UPI002A7FCD8D|nr:xaa-Pro aminopeptidase 1-like isoform X2 [Saccostrea echinata]
MEGTIFFGIFIFGITFLLAESVQRLNDDGLHHRSKRALSPSRKIEIKNMSPNDRLSCPPGQTAPPTRVNTTERLENLRAEMLTAGVDAYIIPSEDAHQSEYPSDYDLRREFISGLSGSAGLAIVTRTQAALWTDGRYFLQAEDELDCNWILMKSGEPGVPSSTEWLISVLGTNAKVGAYPFLINSGSYERYEKALSQRNITMTTTAEDLVGKIWTMGRPEEPNSPINALPLKFAGRSWQDKLADMHKAMTEKDVDAMVVTGLDETAWLLNLRAADIAYNPFFLSYIIVDKKMNETTLYIKNHTAKLTQNPTDEQSTEKLHEHLNTGTSGSCSGRTGYCVQVYEYSSTAVESKVQTVASNSGIVLVSFSCNYALYSKIPEAKRLQENTPAALQKSQKNDVERNGMRNSHKRDAVALITFMTKLEKEVKAGKRWTEVSAARDLKTYREKKLYNRGLSFPSISAVGSNGAVIHYTPGNLTDRQITTSEMYLLDSGGQYLDGTTDVTRTFHFGTPTDFEKESYTRVLMGHVDLAMMTFIAGLYGREIDAIARRPLWEVGLQYRHGTGHGIGMFLSVHEGPGRISLSHAPFESDSPLQDGNFFSDEPGYYEDGKFGIRLENIFMVKEVDTKYKFPNTTFLGFETVTMVPYEPNLIKYDMLSQSQVDWINAYHKKVLELIGPELRANNPEAYNWLESRTRTITRTTSSTTLIFPSVFLITLGILSHFT